MAEMINIKKPEFSSFRFHLAGKTPLLQRPESNQSVGTDVSQPHSRKKAKDQALDGMPYFVGDKPAIPSRALIRSILSAFVQKE